MSVDSVADAARKKANRGGIGGSLYEAVPTGQNIDGQTAHDTLHTACARPPRSNFAGQLGFVDLSRSDLFDQTTGAGFDHLFDEFEAVGLGNQVPLFKNLVDHGYYKYRPIHGRVLDLCPLLDCAAQQNRIQYCEKFMTEYLKTLNGRLNVYFLRHGESEGNTAGIIQGRSDLPLSAKGLKQAEAIASWFTGRQIDAILCSPLRRAAQTAEVVRCVLGTGSVRPEETLNELDTGIFTGLNVTEIRRRYPEAWRSFQCSSWEGVPRAERIEALLERAERLWKQLGALFGQGMNNLLCVTHSGILQWIIKATAGGRSWMPLVPVDNCSISHFSLDNE